MRCCSQTSAFTLLSSFLIQTLIGGFEKSYSIFYLEIIDLFDTSTTVVSTISGVFTFIRLVLGPLVVALISHFGCRKITIVGGFISSISLFICSFSQTITTFFIFYGIIGGIGFSLIFMPSVIVLTEKFDEHRAAAFSVISTGLAVGAAGFPYLVSYWMSLYGLRRVLFLLGGVCMNAIPFGLLYQDKVDECELVITENVENAFQAETENGSQSDYPNEEFLSGFYSNVTTKSVKSDIGQFLTIPSRFDNIGDDNCSGRRKSDNSLVSRSSRNSSEFIIRSSPNVVESLFSSRYRNLPRSGMCIVDFEGSLIEIDFLDVPNDINVQNPSIIFDDATTIAATVTAVPNGTMSVLNDSQNSLERQKKRTFFLYALFKSLSKSFSVKELLHNKVIMVYAIAHIPMIMGFSVWSMYMVQYAKLYGVPENKAISLLAIESGIQIVPRLLTGSLFDLRAVRRYRTLAYMLSVGLATGACLVLVMVPQIADSPYHRIEAGTAVFITMTFLCLLRGIGVGIVFSQCNIIAGDFCRAEQLPSAIGLLSLNKGVGVLLGSIAAGYIMDTVQHYSYVYLYMGLIQLLSCTLLGYVVIKKLSHENKP